MESWTDSQFDLWSDMVASSSPTTMPTFHLNFSFGSSSLWFYPNFWQALQDPIGWLQEVEQMFFAVLSGGPGGSFDVPYLVAAYCEYFDHVIGCMLAAPHGVRCIVVGAIIMDAPYRGLPPAGGELVLPALPDLEADPVDGVMFMWARGGEESSAAVAAFPESVLKVVAFGEGEAEEVYADDSCSICLDDFEAGQQLYVVPCRHRFHMECLKNWLARSHACPLCRFNFFCWGAG